MAGSNRASALLKDPKGTPPNGPKRARLKFLRFFKLAFEDEAYLAAERAYKWSAHEAWRRVLNESEYRSLLESGQFEQIAVSAVDLVAQTNLLTPVETMALRHTAKSPDGAKAFAEGLFHLVYGKDKLETRFARWVAAVDSLPTRLTRVLTWPVVTVFGFLADPIHHIFLKPAVMRAAAQRYGYDFHFKAAPSWETYLSLLQFTWTVRRDVRDLRPRDMIDMQSFIWVQGSDEYDEV
jgi:hypothetical protein